MPEPDASSSPLQVFAAACQEALRYTFRNPELLYQALGILSPPLTPEQAAVRQRLEFLGDAAWNFAVADTAFTLWPDAGAGDLTRIRATWSSRSGLARLARRLALPLPDCSGGPASAGKPEPEGFSSPEELPSLPSGLSSEGQDLRSATGVAPGQKDAGPQETCPAAPCEGAPGESSRPTARTDSESSPAGSSERVVADVPPAATHPEPASPPAGGPSERVVAELFEAILGAMVMDGGLDPVRELARRVISLGGEPGGPPPMDPKSALQIVAQSRFGTLPTYRLLERRGPPHHPTFRVEVAVRADSGNVAASAEGPSRQAAEREAARRALEILSD